MRYNLSKLKGAILLLTGVLCLSELLCGYAAAQPPRGLNIVYPLVASRVSSNYGPRKHPIYRSVRHHHGVDLAAPKNRHVRSVLPGVVIFAATNEGYGKMVSIRHSNGYVSMYGHLNEILVNPGQIVTGGHVIGRVGSTGISTGPHLHFEWRKNGVPIDPIKVLPFLSAKAQG